MGKDEEKITGQQRLAKTNLTVPQSKSTPQFPATVLTYLFFKNFSLYYIDLPTGGTRTVPAQGWRSEGYPSGISSLPPLCGFQGLNSHCEAWRQVPLPTEPSCQTPLQFAMLDSLTNFYVFVCMCVSSQVDMYHMCMQGPKRERRVSFMPWHWSYRRL